ncbi:hypothetical protein MRB53_012738 [Persea americana]|uniref:Uncharacterized protein n=1 Tax=Persea americana TaxID=3435 RepID=A0ACC2LY71_PERAE|nr:hypothetical protein MRB53_012738 [Persea americana]
MAAQLAAFVVVVSMLLEFSHCHDQEIKYGYEGEIAPEKWGNLSPAFQACSKGKMQSPIDIDKNNAFANHKLGSLKRDYIQANATLVNNGGSIGILWSCGNGFFSVDGKNYTLKESIWHTPSEHTLKGKKYAVELQHIHRGDNEQIAVVVSLYKEGDSDSFHDELKDALATLSKETCSDDELAQIPVGTIDSGHLTRSSHNHVSEDFSLFSLRSRVDFLFSLHDFRSFWVEIYSSLQKSCLMGRILAQESFSRSPTGDF